MNKAKSFLGIDPPRNIPQNVWKLMAFKDKAPILEREVLLADQAATSESSLHLAFYKQLVWRGIVPIHSRMDVETTYAPGIPDFVFAVARRAGGSLGAAVEFKWKKGTPSPEQTIMIEAMRANQWHVSVAWSVAEAMQFLKSIEEEAAL